MWRVKERGVFKKGIVQVVKRCNCGNTLTLSIFLQSLSYIAVHQVKLMKHLALDFRESFTESARDHYAQHALNAQELTQFTLSMTRKYMFLHANVSPVFKPTSVGLEAC